jgi:hypothetical protein
MLLRWGFLLAPVFDHLAFGLVMERADDAGSDPDETCLIIPVCRTTGAVDFLATETPGWSGMARKRAHATRAALSHPAAIIFCRRRNIISVSNRHAGEAPEGMLQLGETGSIPRPLGGEMIDRNGWCPPAMPGEA